MKKDVQPNELISVLEKYISELEAILARFTSDRAGIHIKRSDDGRYREIALELCDLFEDEFADGAKYVRQLRSAFNESVSNFLQSPSYKGVENVKGIVAAVAARV